MKQRLKTGWEWDWTTGWRKVMGWKSGTGKYIKRGMNRRLRKEGKQQVRGIEHD